ncbi:MotA/TolQ/ExbB proton channel family protein [Algicola sagamiensis]|uniref:MotA/TolQ/ExbB proton channel family protein n=1 Tax=Algicola sagamiensis TaxID=163869 RepID=UPI000362B82F|nr:MotA/TolQ/ExbB proton channel family protein [Algicola sagamiensis]
MKKVFKNILIASSLAMTVGATNAYAAESLDDLLKQVKQDRISEAKINKKREAEFKSEQADKQALLNKAKAELKEEQARQKRLQDQFASNVDLIAAKQKELADKQGTLGEMVGVVRRASNDAIGSITASLISAEHKGRTELLKKLSESKALPTTKDLEELWIALQTEMTESGKVSKFDAKVTELDGKTNQKSITRVGSFNLLGDGRYLMYNPNTGVIEPLGRPAEGRFSNTISNIQNAQPGQMVPLFVDPTKGGLLRLKTREKTLEQHYQAGGTVGYIITGVLIIGLLIALERLIVLGGMGAAIRKQLKDTSKLGENPLGRVLKVYQENKETDVENLELKLDEAILRETPRIERGIGLIKILASIAPLLGLLGTVTGMIGTFQQITLFGTGDPKVMAGNISLALVTTALGLIAALPLIFVHSIVSSRSKSIVHVLDEQSVGIIAAHAEKEKH